MTETISLKEKEISPKELSEYSIQNGPKGMGSIKVTPQNSINPKIELEKLKEDFKRDGFVEVNDFLSEGFAKKCHKFYFNDMPDDWWRAASFPNIDPNSKDIKYQRLHEDMRETRSSTLKHFDNGSFAYFFHRTTDDHPKECGCGECDLRRFFKSDEVLVFLSKLTGIEVSSDSGHFSSWYRKGDFLSAHHDEGNGKVGVVLDFCKKWNPVFGGNLFMLEDDWFTCKKVITPKFNNLKIFDIPKGKKGVPHFVSTVLAEDRPDRKRISFGGWFK